MIKEKRQKLKEEQKAENKKQDPDNVPWDDDHSYSNLFLVRRTKACRLLASIAFSNLRKLWSPSVSIDAHHSWVLL